MRISKERAAHLLELAFLNGDKHLAEDEICYETTMREVAKIAIASLRNGGLPQQHVYVWNAAEGKQKDPIIDVWTTSVPEPGEQIIIWQDESFHHYEVVRRIYGINAEDRTACWNIYVEPSASEEQS